MGTPVPEEIVKGPRKSVPDTSGSEESGVTSAPEKEKDETGHSVGDK